MFRSWATLRASEMLAAKRWALEVPNKSGRTRPGVLLLLLLSSSATPWDNTMRGGLSGEGFGRRVVPLGWCPRHPQLLTGEGDGGGPSPATKGWSTRLFNAMLAVPDGGPRRITQLAALANTILCYSWLEAKRTASNALSEGGSRGGRPDADTPLPTPFRIPPASHIRAPHTDLSPCHARVP